MSELCGMQNEFFLRQPISDNATILASFKFDKQNEIKLRKMLNMMYACVKLLLMLCKLILYIENRIVTDDYQDIKVQLFMLCMELKDFDGANR